MLFETFLAGCFALQPPSTGASIPLRIRAGQLAALCQSAATTILDHKIKPIRIALPSSLHGLAQVVPSELLI